MSGYVKLWEEVLSSSVWGLDDKTRIVWITILAMKDINGIVHAASSGIAHQARVSAEDCAKALKILGDPDEDSRSPDMEGRRIIRVDGGFKVVNSAKYRSKEGPSGRKDYMRKYMRKYRSEIVNPSKLTLTFVNPDKPELNPVNQCKQIVNTFPESPSEYVNNGKHIVNGSKTLLKEAEADTEAYKEPPISPKGGGTVHDFSLESEPVKKRRGRQKAPPVSDAPPTISEFVQFAVSKNITVAVAEKQYEVWDLAHWNDGNGTPIYSWTSKLVKYQECGWLVKLSESTKPVSRPMPLSAPLPEEHVGPRDPKVVAEFQAIKEQLIAGSKK